MKKSKMIASAINDMMKWIRDVGFKKQSPASGPAYNVFFDDPNPDKPEKYLNHEILNLDIQI